jgi:hypothetical protein
MNSLKTSRNWAAGFLLLGFTISIILPPPLMALDCSPDEITLSSQADIDDFQDDHGQCDRVVGNLDIDGADIENVNGLSDLIQVGNLRFLFTSALSDLSGLASLTTVDGSLFFTDCDSLTNLNGLSSLSSVGDVVRFSFMESLLNLDGLSSLNSAGSILLEFNTALTDIDGLASIAGVDGSITLESNIALLNLDGFSGLATTGGSFELVGQTLLTNIEGLSSLISVGGDFRMESNPLLAHCSSLSPLLDNQDHGDPGPGPGAGGVPDVGGAVTIDGNLRGCNSIDEIINPIFTDSFELPANTITVVDDPVNSVGAFTSIAIGTDGYPIISYADGTDGALKVAKCHDVKCAGGNETITQIENPPGVVTYTSISIGTDGFPVIGFNNGLSLKVVSCDDEFCAGGNETITVLDSSDIGLGFYLSLTHGIDGFPVMSYYDDDADQLRVAKCNDPTCADGEETVTIVDTAKFSGIYTSIAIGADGFPVISYGDGSHDLKVVKCNDPACAGGDESISVVDAPEGVQVGEYTSIAVGADGFPVISYYDRTAGALRVAKCNDAACAGSDEIISIVDDSVNQAGIDTSITIGADGLPIISYYAQTIFTNGFLRTAKCNDLACSGGDEIIQTVDDPASGVVGTYTSIAIGSDGLPVVSYRDHLAGTLKVVHCGTSKCGRR